MTVPVDGTTGFDIKAVLEVDITSVSPSPFGS